MQLVRGTTNPDSSLYGHDLLGDLYGDKEALQRDLLVPTIQIRNFIYTPANYTNPLNTLPSMNYMADNLQRPMLLGAEVNSGAESQMFTGHFLKIPLDPFYRNPPNAPIPVLPDENDALTGRIVTFPAGNGPLSGQSFRVVRYIGAVPSSADPALFAQRFSITIDITEADLSRSFSQVDSVIEARRL